MFKRFSTDDGGTWTSDLKVTDVAFGVPSLSPNFDPLVAHCYMGEYNHIASDTDNFYFVWGDNRNIVSGHPDPDIFFETEHLTSQGYIGRPWLDILVSPTTLTFWLSGEMLLDVCSRTTPWLAIGHESPAPRFCRGKYELASFVRQ